MKANQTIFIPRSHKVCIKNNKNDRSFQEKITLKSDRLDLIV
jgi:hypothetical protein